MGLSKDTRNGIRDLLVGVVRDKLQNYQPETKHMPFHHRLLGKDRYAVFSFIHSINTQLGTSIWEQVAVLLAIASGYEAQRSFKLLGEIDKDTRQVIDSLHLRLREGSLDANKKNETEEVRRIISAGNALKHPDSNVDLYVVINGWENYIDIKTAKPNKEGFAVLKRKLLMWTALRLSQEKTAKVITRIAIPYNPYHPKPYDRWTMKGLFDLEAGEVLVAEEFWNWVAGDDIYEDLLDVFQEAGVILRSEIDKRFEQFK